MSAPHATRGTLVGHKLGRYNIEEQIGAGGMSVVYRAVDTTLGRSIAIKVLPEHCAKDAERRSRFEREARLLAALNHRNIAAIHGLEANCAFPDTLGPEHYPEPLTELGKMRSASS
jgi:serine/threonine protein kinase